MAGPVLVVNPHAGTLAEQLLAFQRADYAVVGASSFAEARALLTKLRPSVLVTCVRIAEFNGLHLAILARLKHGSLPTIVIGEADTVLEREAEKLGAQFILPPPPAELVCIARRATDGDAPPRRWRRIRPGVAVAALAGGLSCEIVDLSYGGIGLSVGDGAPALPEAFDIDLPVYGIRIQIRRIWEANSAGHRRCGLAVAPLGADVPKNWRSVVDLVRGESTPQKLAKDACP